MSSVESGLEIVVEAAYSGGRVDKFLGDYCSDLSRSRIKKLIADGCVRLNNDVLQSVSYKVEEGDVLVIHVPEPEPSEPQPEDIPLDIIYEDDDLIVLNKPVGLVVHPGAGNWTGTLVNALLHHCGDSLSGIGGVARPGIVHRLDKDTSGLMLVAKNDKAHQFLSDQLTDRTLSRIYHALVIGVPIPIKGVVDRPIGRDRNNRLKMSVVSNTPKDARTHYRVLQNYDDACSLVECKLESGRTHQIRVHMEAVGCSLIGDPLYGPQPTQLISYMKKAGYGNDIIKEFIEFKYQVLYAKQISFVHPSTEEVMEFTIDDPDEISMLLKKLDK